MATPADDFCDIFLGAVSPAVSRVYARYHGPSSDDVLQLQGTLVGPNCEYAATLPATLRFVDRGPGGPPLAEAVVPEPSFWTPEMPQLYRAKLELSRGGQVVACCERDVGIRRFGVAGRRLRLDTKTWVLRGAIVNVPKPDDLAAWHAAATALVVTSPSDVLCERASRLGVLIVAELPTPTIAELRRLSRWPAVGIVSLPPGTLPPLQDLGHNLLLAERFVAGQRFAPSAWADLVICDSECLADAPEVALPVVVSRQSVWSQPHEARAACDRLQRDLAARGQYAGYIG